MSSGQGAPRAELFKYLLDREQLPLFFESVSDDVRWTVLGTHPVSGTFYGKAELIEGAFRRMDAMMQGSVRLEVREIHDAGDVVVVELVSYATTRDGQPFDNTYCWVCRFEDDRIVEVRAYVDSALVAATAARLEGQEA